MSQNHHLKLLRISPSTWVIYKGKKGVDGTLLLAFSSENPINHDVLIIPVSVSCSLFFSSKFSSIPYTS